MKDPLRQHPDPLHPCSVSVFYKLNTFASQAQLGIKEKFDTTPEEMLVFTGAAIRDLDRVWAEVFEASKDIEITERHIEELFDKVEKKSDYPESGSPLYYENSFTGYYFVVFKAYLAFYRLEKETILVDRVLFGKIDYMRILRLA